MRISPTLCLFAAWFAMTVTQPASAADTASSASASGRPATAAEFLHRRFVEAFNAADMTELLSLYEPSAGIVPQPDTVEIGHDRIRSVLSSFLAVKGTLRFTTRHAVEVGDLALLRGEYQLEGVDANGKAVSLRGRTVEIARKQGDGSWRFAIDFPNGAD